MKNYRNIVNQMLDLCDDDDIHGLIATCEAVVQSLRARAEYDKTDQARRAFDRSIAPWFSQEVDHA